MEKDKISVIVPVYKVEEYLPKCLDSIINQTYKNLEIILIDDGSPDNSGKICDEYAEKDSRIKVIHKENGGLSDARNKGMEFATGEYIVFADSDDWLELDMYEALMRHQAENDADVTYCGFYIEKENTEVSALEASFTETGKDFQGKVICSAWLYSVVWNKLIKISVIGDVSFNKKLDYSEDAFFLYEISKNVNKACFLNKPLYHYNKMNNSSVTATRDFSKSLLYVREFFVNDTRHDKNLNEIAVGSLVQSFTMLINWAIKTKNTEKSKTWTKRLKQYKKEIFSSSHVSMRKKMLIFLLFYCSGIYYILCACKGE